jgi:phospholipid/cholesterol/gamma-HCH transport system substrate-binding protein
MAFKFQWKELNELHKRTLLFVVGCLVLMVVVVIGVGYARGWFDAKVVLYTHFRSGLGLREGTEVLLSGVPAGSISEVEVISHEQIQVSLSIRRKYARQIYTDAVAKIIRQLSFGDKKIDIWPGGIQSKDWVNEGTVIEGRDSREILDILSSDQFHNYFDALERLAGNLSEMLKPISDLDEETHLAKSLGEVYPTLRAVQSMAAHMKTITNTTVKLEETIHPLMGEMSGMTRDLAQVTPVLANLAPQMETLVKQLAGALSEMTLTLRAMQRSFFLRGAVKEIEKEDKGMTPQKDKDAIHRRMDEF